MSYSGKKSCTLFNLRRENYNDEDVEKKREMSEKSRDAIFH